MDGVVRTRVGYAGGTKRGPTYHELGDHTEVFQVEFNPNTIHILRALRSRSRLAHPTEPN
jgi:peptide methionine sulfoxide reductase MsrA